MITTEMTDTAFLDAVTDASLPAEFFDHRAHLRLAWICLRQHGVEAGAPRVAGLIRTYAEARGATGKFDADLTQAWMGRVWAAMGKSDSADFRVFLDASPELLKATPSA